MVDGILGRAIPEPAVETVGIWGDGAALAMTIQNFMTCSASSLSREGKSYYGMRAATTGGKNIFSQKACLVECSFMLFWTA
jgi:hypothetical protein